LLASLIALLAGCGGPTLDASSKDALQKSMERMTAGMTDEEKGAFGADCMTVVLPDMMKNAFSGLGGGSPPSLDEAEMFKPLHGLTVEQIRKKAEEVRDAAK
jgi:hypothetical protein